MCRGVPQESIHTSSRFHLSLLHEQVKRSPHPEHHHHDDQQPHNVHGDAHPAAHDHPCPDKTATGDLISRGHPVLPRPPLGLAIVAAIHHQSQLAADCVSSASIIVRRQLPTEKADQQFKRASVIELKISERRKNGSSALKSSIFSITFESPLAEDSDCSSNSCHGSPNYDFLGACFFCARLLGPGKDVYMYRGDRAFCSSECRYQHIVADERTESRRGQRARPLANQRPPAVPQPVKICRSIAVLS